MVVTVGTKLNLSREVMTYQNGPKAVPLSDIFSNKKVVLFSLPGALTPTCTEQQAPGFIQRHADVLAKGVDTIICLSVNDPFVMNAFKKQLNAEDKILFLADGDAGLTRELGIDFDTKGFGGVRARRGVFLVEDGVFKVVCLEEGGEYKGNSSVDTILAKL